MVRWKIVYTKQAKRDVKKLLAAGLKKNAEKLLAIIAENPLKNPPAYEKLVGNFAGAYSRRINVQHRLIYQLFQKERTVKVIRMWSHYE